MLQERDIMPLSVRKYKDGTYITDVTPHEAYVGRTSTVRNTELDAEVVSLARKYHELGDEAESIYRRSMMKLAVTVVAGLAVFGAGAAGAFSSVLGATAGNTTAALGLSSLLAYLLLQGIRDIRKLKEILQKEYEIGGKIDKTMLDR